jgi:TorA maturation chaperone TorD
MGIGRICVAEAATDFEPAEEEGLRAAWYRLLSRLMAKAPDRQLLGQLRGMTVDDTDFGKGLRALAAAAKAASPDALEREYFNLFIGVGRGELIPFGSYYLAGFLHEKPLAKLRDDMGLLGIARSEGVPESEDHIASLCEIMAGLITGSFGPPADLATQHHFFQDHIGSWAPRFFKDLEAAQSAAFYMPVGTLGRTFMAVESQAFEMVA